MRNQGQVLTMDNLLQAGLGDWDGEFVSENTVSVTIRRLRKKIEPDMSRPVYIRNVFGLGYRMGGVREIMIGTAAAFVIGLCIGGAVVHRIPEKNRGCQELKEIERDLREYHERESLCRRRLPGKRRCTAGIVASARYGCRRCSGDGQRKAEKSRDEIQKLISEIAPSDAHAPCQHEDIYRLLRRDWNPEMRQRRSLFWFILPLWRRAGRNCIS